MKSIWRKRKRKKRSRRKRKLDLRVTRKKEWVTYKGGKCSKCGYHECVQALTFHHVNPALKRFSISGGGDSRYDLSRGTAGRSREEIYAELDKCALLCCRCHSELHAGVWSFN